MGKLKPADRICVALDHKTQSSSIIFSCEAEGKLVQLADDPVVYVRLCNYHARLVKGVGDG